MYRLKETADPGKIGLCRIRRRQCVVPAVTKGPTIDGVNPISRRSTWFFGQLTQIYWISQARCARSGMHISWSKGPLMNPEMITWGDTCSQGSAG